MSNNEKYREAYDMLCEWKEWSLTLQDWELGLPISHRTTELSKWLLDNKGLKVCHEDYIYLQDLQKAIDDQKTPLYNPVKNISRSKYERCTKNYNGVDLYQLSKAGGVWMYKSFCNKYYYWADYNAKNEVIYFRGEVDWVKSNYEAYEDDYGVDTVLEKNITPQGVARGFKFTEDFSIIQLNNSVYEMHKSLEPFILENEEVGFGKDDVLASFSVADDAFDTGGLGREEEYVEAVECPEADKLITPVTEWTDKHYDLNYTLTEEDIEQGFVKLDVYKVAKVWRTGSKDDSGALWHSLKTIARFGEKNTVEREVKALYEQVKGLAREHGVDLDE